MHLLSLMRHSDEVLRRLLIAAGRSDMLMVLELDIVREKLVETLEFIDRLHATDSVHAYMR